MNFIRKAFLRLSKNRDLSARILLVLVVIGALGFAIFLSGPKPDSLEDYAMYFTPTPLPTNFPIPMPVYTTQTVSPEYAQTTGVMVGVITVVLIVVLGTLYELLRSKKSEAEKDVNNPH
jgi:hypothetical protein